jgi:membrane protein DedA with SNARE-associated domain
LSPVEQFVVNQVGTHGYLAVFVLMVVGSACIPIPSEAVMLFGGALAGGVSAAGAHVHLSLVGIVLAGLGGNLVGSLVAYAVGRTGGRPVLDRYGKYVLLRKSELDKAEEFFVKHGQSAVFLGRMVPLVRAFVSLPAGIAQMRAVPFTVLTLLGSLPWVLGLAIGGDLLASHWKSVSNAFTPISIVVGVLVVLLVGWWALHKIRAQATGPGPGIAEAEPVTAPKD